MRAIALVALVVFLAAVPVWADARLDEFRREYPRQSQQVERFYRSLTIHAHESFIERPDGQLNVADIAYWGGSDRLAVELLYRSNREGANYWFKGGRDIAAATPGCSFAITSQSDGTLLVTNLRRDRVGYQKGQDKVLHQARFASAPYCILDTRVSAFVTDKALRLLTIGDETQEGERVTKVTWDVQVPEAERGGWFTFLPDNGWVLTGYEIRHHVLASPYAIPSRLCGRIEYRVEQGFELPLVKSVKQWSEQPDDEGNESGVAQFDITAIERGVADPQVFELSHYDLEPKAHKGRSAYFWLVTLLVVSMMAAIGFRYLAKRGGKPA